MLAPPRQFTKCAGDLGTSVTRLHRLSSRHHWRSRAKAFDLHLARAQSRALEQLTVETTADWKARAERFRMQEWALHEELIEAASIAARELRTKPRCFSLNDICKIYELAFTLGRLACGLPLDGSAPQPDHSRLNAEAEAALNKVYGHKRSSGAETIQEPESGHPISGPTNVATPSS